MNRRNGSPRPLRITAFLLAALASAFVVGCRSGAEYFVLHSDLQYTETPQPPSQTVRSAAAGSGGAPVRTVGLLWPDHCENTTASENEGHVDPLATVLHIDCSVQIAELERSLVHAGYRVVHWDTVRRYATVHETTPERAAQLFGVQALVRVNSLELARAQLGGTARWVREYHYANAYGEEGIAAMVPARRADSFDNILQELESSGSAAVRLAVSMNVTVQLIPGGEAVLFYSWVKVASVTGSGQLRQFVSCGPLGCSRSEPMARGVAAQPSARSGSSRDITREGADADVTRAQHHALMLEVYSDFTTQLQVAAITHSCDSASVCSGDPASTAR